MEDLSQEPLMPWVQAASLFFLLLPLFLLLLLLSYRVLLVSSRHDQSSSKGSVLLNLPPSPPKLPFIGNFHQISPSRPYQSLSSLAHKYGADLMLLRFGQVPTLIVSSADAAKEILKNHDGVFCNRPSLKAPRMLLYGGSDIALTSYGDYWRQSKKLVVSHLLGSKKMQSYKPVREEEVALLMDRVAAAAAAAAAPDHEEGIDMTMLMDAFIDDLFFRAVAGKQLKEDGWSRVMRAIMKEFAVIIDGFFVQDFFPGWGEWLDELLGFNRRARKNMKKWDGFLDKLIDEHDLLDHHPADPEEKDFLHHLLASLQEDQASFTPSRDQIKGILQDMFAGSTDSSAVTLEWALAHLIRNPKNMKELQDEVREVAGASKMMIREEDLDKMVYLKAVVKEVTRLHPASPLLLPRESMEDCRVLGFDIPRRTRVIINAWAIARDPRNWDSPDQFDPDRFLNHHGTAAAAAAADFKGNDFQFIPFGAGRRICPGFPFALVVLELALANLVLKFDWELPHGMLPEEMDMDPFPSLLIRKREPLLLVPKPWKQ